MQPSSWRRSVCSFISLIVVLTLASGSIPAASVLAQGSAVPTPEQVLGYRVGADRKLADWNEVVGYFAKLAAATPAVSIETLGKTTMGKPLIAAIDFDAGERAGRARRFAPGSESSRTRAC